MSVKVIRLTILVICWSLCFWVVSCSTRRADEGRTEKKSSETAAHAVNLNTAGAEELEKLPLIGTELARRIIRFREENGKFRRVEHLLLVRGMSDKKFRQLQNLIKAE
jgi:competence ComEA-like helix-hairpin-helix protein